ncbi:MAG: T9SS type A sorting domain-containing protein, partial [Ignavibacteriae bacterium]|nr:T9SS type A sorting domain-containing protein [Ignavibacteriota bacterium]
NGISFVNRDTGWVGGTAGGVPYLWRTTNRGVNWIVQSGNTGFGRVFFLRNKLNGEYIGWSQNYEEVWKTTTSGINWFRVMDVGYSSQLYFLDEKTGFAATGDNMKKTTNGGLNWNAYYMPTNNGILFNVMNKFKVIYKDTIFGDYGVRTFSNGQNRGIIWVSTNGGVNWGFQQPDTSIQRRFSGIDFYNKDTGWSTFIRTNDGGGQVIITGINSGITEKPDIFKLEQNYPNPFNSSTRIDFSVSIPSYVSLAVYDITGKEVVRIYNNEYFLAGNYFAGIDVGKMKLSSGIYVYRMTVTDSKQNNVFIKSRKLVYMK